MKEKKYEKKKINSLANDLYSPKSELFHDFCKQNKNIDKKIICFNQLLKLYKFVTIYKKYYYIVIKNDDDKHFYIVDDCFVETEKIVINFPSNYKNENITGIAYNASNGKVFIAIRNILFSNDIHGNFIKIEINDYSLKKIVTDKCACENEKFINKCQTTKILKPCITGLGISNDNIFVTYEKYGSSFISKLTKNGNLVNDKYIDDDITTYMIIDSRCYLYVFALKNCKYKYIYTFDKTNSICDNHKGYCEIILDDECRIDIECDDFPCSLDGCLCEVIKSIALIESSLAKLITCESEKIKNAIDKAVCNKELLDINKSVSKTIMNISMLEQILKEKLEVALDIYECEYHKKPCICEKK